MNDRWRSTYDAWKLASPDDERNLGGRWFIGECDCCGKRTGIRRTIAHNIETFACASCTDADGDMADG